MTNEEALAEALSHQFEWDELSPEVQEALAKNGWDYLWNDGDGEEDSCYEDGEGRPANFYERYGL